MSLRANPSYAFLFLYYAMLNFSVANVSPALPCLRETSPLLALLFRCRSSHCRSFACLFIAFPMPLRADRRTAFPVRSTSIQRCATPSPCLLPLRFSAAASYAASPSHAIPMPSPSWLNYSHAVLQPAFPLPMPRIATHVFSIPLHP